jgi:hypothetical protein
MTSPIYEWAADARVRTRVPAQAVGDTIASIEERDGTCHPTAFVAAARPTDSPVHGLFDWDVERAAERHWEDVARHVIRSVRIVVDESADGKARQQLGFVSVTLVGATGADQGYVSTVRALTDEELRKQVEADVLGQLRGLRRRYEQVTTFQAVWEAVERVADELEATEQVE